MHHLRCFRALSKSQVHEGVEMGKSRLLTILGGVLVLAVVVVTLLAVRSRAGDKAPAVGTAAPDFTLNSQDGKPISLHDYKGKWVVLYFYPKDMTTGCTIEAHNFQQDMPKYQQLDAVVVGVSVDSTGSHKEFCAKEGLSFKL